jgi:FkbM family methyltransferase
MQYHASDISIFNRFIGENFKLIPDVKVIFDIGSCHCLESVEFSKLYTAARIVAFEPNPVSYQVCLNNTKNISSITVVNQAINEFDGSCKFYPMDKEKTITTWEDGNQGASSLYLANGAYDNIEKYVQYEIEVPCTRIDTYCRNNNIDHIDAIWMDLQGAELKALKSMGNLLDSVKVIHTELEVNPMYEGQCLFKDVNTFLQERGFDLVWGNTKAHFGTDFIFVKRK